MAIIIDNLGGPREYYEPSPGYYVPVLCNAAYFGGRADESVLITVEQAHELFDREQLATTTKNQEREI